MKRRRTPADEALGSKAHELANAKRRLTGLIDLSFPEFSRHFDDIHSKGAHAVLIPSRARSLKDWRPGRQRLRIKPESRSANQVRFRLNCPALRELLDGAVASL